MLLQRWAKLRNAVVILYSVAIMVTIVPGLDRIPPIVVLLYYVIFPGYTLTLVLRQDGGIVQTVFFSFLWSVVVLGSVASLLGLTPNLTKVPLNGVIPILTVVLVAYAYYHGR